jgi:uncharacterized OsmC-like protein
MELNSIGFITAYFVDQGPLKGCEIRFRFTGEISDKKIKTLNNLMIEQKPVSISIKKVK